MSLVVAWLAFPAVLCVLALGCGLAVERVTGARLPGNLLIPAGLAVVLVAGTAATMTDATARLAAPVVVVLAATGLMISPPWKERARFDAWALGAAACVFAVFAAPVVLSGHATFAGYIKLDDTAAWAALTDHVMTHGRSIAGLAPSSHEAALDYYLNRGYPVGSLVPLGIGARVLGHDPLWLFQPWLSFLAATLSLTLNALLTSAVPDRRVRAACALIAAQPALLFGFAMWAGVKEMATAWIVALTAAVLPLVSRERGLRSLVWVVIGGAAALATASFAGAVWVGPALVFALVTAVRRREARTLRVAGAVTALGVVLLVPSVALAHSFLTKFAWNGKLFTHAVTPQLPNPISLLEVFGVWPTGDFRLGLSAAHPARVAILVVAVSALGGIVVAAAKRSWALVLYGIATSAVALAIAALTSPWFAAKALAICAPAVLALATAGIVALWRPGCRSLSSVAAVALVGGVLLSNARAYQGVSLAPRDQLEELRHIGRLAAGQGPTLITEYNPYGSQYFLGPADGEGVSEYMRRRGTWLRDGRAVPPLSTVDMDQIDMATLLVYRSLVVRRSPAASRPPSVYRLVWQGHTYELWQRPVRFRPVEEHVPLGGPVTAGWLAPCGKVRKLAGRAGPGGRLVTVERSIPTVVRLGGLSLPPGWVARAPNSSIVFPRTKGTLTADLAVPAAGRFDVWLGGGVYGLLTVSIDGKRVGAVRSVPNPDGAYLSLGTAALRAGGHRVTITLDDGGLRPGIAAQRYTPTPFLLGPLVLDPAPQPRKLRVIPATRWRDLCGQALDWIEAFPKG